MSSDIGKFYDVPVTGPVELRGGVQDGKRTVLPLTCREIACTDFNVSYDVIKPVNLSEIMVHSQPSLRTHLYRWTGSILDDGTRVFQAVV